MVQVYKLVEKIERIEEPEKLGELNPKYFEEAVKFEEAKEKLIASDIYAGSKFNLFNAF
ncbi:MAG: hypothetical protein ACFFE4_06170 [Candidatus Thorarchaeota archaeon]